MTSINPATQPQEQLNEFTRAVKQLGSGQKRGEFEFFLGEYYVRLRNGTLVRPVFTLAEDKYCEDTFQYQSDKMYYCWNLDGTSVTRRDYDMMEIIRRD